MTIVLVVDDDTGNLRALQSVIEAAGYEVVPAGDGAEAFIKLRTVNPRVVVTDWQMPDMDGWTLCRKMHDIPQYARVPVILLSANVVPVDEYGCWSAFFRKPANIGSLLRCIASFCSIGRTSRSAFLDSLGPAASRWQAVNPRCWP